MSKTITVGIEDFLIYQRDRLKKQIESVKSEFRNGRITRAELKEIRKEIDFKFRAYRHIAEDCDLDLDTL